MSYSGFFISLAAVLALGGCGAAMPSGSAPLQGSTAVPSPEGAQVQPSEALQVPPEQDTVITSFYASGSSPAWFADLNHDHMTFQVPVNGKATSPKTVKVERLAFAKGAEYTGYDDGIEVTLSVNSRPCTRPRKNGRRDALTATLYYGDIIYRGCADPRQQ